jgi:hypothetical protein
LSIKHVTCKSHVADKAVEGVAVALDASTILSVAHPMLPLAIKVPPPLSLQNPSKLLAKSLFLKINLSPFK